VLMPGGASIEKRDQELTGYALELRSVHNQGGGGGYQVAVVMKGGGSVNLEQRYPTLTVHNRPSEGGDSLVGSQKSIWGVVGAVSAM